MAILKVGSLSVTTGGAAQNLVLGFIPSYFKMVNQTTVTGTFMGEWFSSMANGSSLKWRVGGTPVFTSDAADGITPFSTADNLLFVPNSSTASLVAPYQANFSTNLVISNATPITKAANAEITATHAFQTSDIGVTVVTFHGIRGMTQMNNLSGVVTGITGTTKFTVNINSTNFSTHVPADGAVANVITGAPTNTLYGNQSLPTSQANLGQIGLTLGTDYMENTNDVWNYVAILQSPATGP